MSSETLRLALCQHDTVWENAPETLRRIDSPVRRFCEKARPDILLFPEAFSTGFTMNPAQAEPEDGPSATWLRGIASGCSVAVIASVPTVVKDTDGEECRYNRCRFITPDGREEIYDKRHLFATSGESPAFSHGKSRTTVSYKGWRIELNVCYDLRFPVWSRNTGELYDLLINIANWPDSRIEAAQILLRARAVENACYAAFCNRIGRDAICRYNGKSMILDYLGHDIARSRRVGGVRFFSSELKMEPLRHYREKFPVSRDSDRFEILI
ncbi:MAG: nitrilase family protein [Bacteroidales bacterium]|nr:nitrilase family protein [Bacteroidales bacterium]